MARNVEVDQEACIGCGQCIEICPEVFQMIADKAMAMNPEKSDSCDIDEAVELCPANAITVEE